MRYLLPLMVLKLLILSWVMGQGLIGLSPDEAQYWTWSQSLDWGYYSKPPGIAWQIFLTTQLFGNTLFGVRFGALILSLCLPLAVYWLALQGGVQKKSALWAALIAAFSPLGVYLSFAATTDGGAILFLTLATGVILRGIDKGPNYWVVGVLIFLGALFKWTAFIVWPLVLFFLPVWRPLRRWSLVGGMVLSLLALLPSLYWNLFHEWATFRHVGATVTAETQGNFFDFIGAQMGLLTPIFFLLLLLALFSIKRMNIHLQFLSLFVFALLGYLGLALFKKMQPNWAAYLYLPSLVLIPWYAREVLKKGAIWLHCGLWLALLMNAAAFSIPWIQKNNLLPIPYKYNPFRQAVGWEHLPTALAEVGYDAQSNFLFGDKYQTASILSFYSPEQKRAYFFNISETRHNQFSYWPQMEERERGRTGFFVVLENREAEALPWYEQHYVERLRPFFADVTLSGAFPLFHVENRGVKYALIFKCENYSGIPAEKSIHF